MYKKKALVALVALFMGVPFVSGADTTCPALSRSLSFGARGNDVVQLQEFLIAEGALASGLNTGYFGRKTDASVRVWQSQQGVDPIGIVGPKTRAAIAVRCGIANPNNQTFSASPTSGTAPLTVTFHSNIKNPTRVELGFGDGTAREVFYSGISHIYTSPGVYTAELIQWSGGICSTPQERNCFDQVGDILQKTTITVR